MNKTKALFVLFLFFTILFLFYLPGFSEESFLIDDSSLVVIPQVRSGVTWEWIKTLFTPGLHIDFYPIRDFSYWIDIHFFHADPELMNGTVYRVQNFFWFFGSVILLFFILGEIGFPIVVALCSTLLWMVHPMHSELLMWISARKDGMSLFFALASCLLWVRFHKGSIQAGVLGIFTHVLGLGSKASATFLPFGFAITNFSSSAHRRLYWVFLMFLSLASAYLQSKVYSSVNDMRFHYEWSYRIKAVFAAFGRATVGVFDFRANTVDVENWGNWLELNHAFIAVGMLALFALMGLSSYELYRAFITKKRDRVFFVLLFWLSYLPVSAILFPHRNFYSIRYFEIPFLILWVSFLLFFKEKLSTKRSLFTFAILICVFAIQSFFESKNWSNSIAPFEKALRLTPANTSLDRMLFDSLQNLDRWGKLTREQKIAKDEVENRIENECVRDVYPQSFPNGSLCLEFWMRNWKRSVNHDSERAKRLSAFIESSLKLLNPAAWKRAEEQMNFFRKLGEKKVSNLASGAVYHNNDSTSLKRFESVLRTCFTIDSPNGAQQLLKSYKARALLEDSTLKVLLVEWFERYPVLKERVSRCFLGH